MRISSEKSLNFKHPSDSKSDGKSLAYAENDQPFIEGREMKKFSPLYRQILAAGAPILSTVAAGFTTGFSAIFLPQLEATSSAVRITNDEGSWLASIAAFGMAPGCLIGGFIMQRYGRKFAHYFLCLPTVLGWLAIFVGGSVPLLLVGRFLTGLATGLLGPVATISIGETSEPKYRGFLLATITLSISFGILLCHISGTFLHYKVIALVAGIFPIFIFMILSIVPESPSWLLAQHRVKEAKNSFLWLRGRSEDAITELDDLLRKHEMVKKEEDASNIKSDSFIKLKANMKKPEFVKPLSIILFFFFVMQFSGVNSVAFYTVSLMKSVTGPGIEYLSMILIDLVRVVGSFIACILLKLCYRRTLMLVSGIGTSICMLSASLFMYFDKMNPDYNYYSYLSMAFLIAYVFLISLGTFPLPWVLQGEMLPQLTRGLSSGITSSFNFLCFFIVVKTFVEMSEALEVFGVFLCYGCVSLIGTLVLWRIMPETKNKTLQQIEESFSKE